MRKITIFLFVALTMCFFCIAKEKSPAYVISLDFKTGVISPYGGIELGDGDVLEVKVEKLPTENIEITVNGVVSQEKKEGAGVIRAAKEGIVKSIRIIHRSEMVAYQVNVKRIDTGFSRGWVIPVITTHWTVDFSGAFTGDTLGKPSYYLEPGVRENPTTKAPENGFYVRKDPESSKFGLGTAAMVHLYYDSHKHKMKIIPITFGIGIGTGSNVRYYVGPSLRFGGAGFFTAGAVFGDVDRPPATAQVDSFVSDANALANMANKKKVGFFVGFSYSFVGGNAQKYLQQPFALPSTTETPKPTETTPADATPPDIKDPKITDAKYDKASNSIVITGTDFGNDRTKINVIVENSKNQDDTFTFTDSQFNECNNEKITFTKLVKMTTGNIYKLYIVVDKKESNKDKNFKID